MLVSSVLYIPPDKLFFRNQNEFVNLMALFKVKIFRLARRLLISTEEAGNATQVVLVKLWIQK